MGTQFSSRLTPSDTKRILAGIRATRESIGKPVRQRGRAASDSTLSSKQQQALGEATVAQVLLVAEDHAFSDDFQKSSFVLILSWLKKLQSDAKFNGFQAVIDEYGLASSANPIAELARRLNATIDAEARAKPDPFRVSISTAAKSVLAEAAIRDAAGRADELPAHKFGRKLAAISLKDLVDRFIRAFLTEFVSSIVSRADPNHAEKVVQDAIAATGHAAERVARTAVKRVEDEGKLADTERIREIVGEELRRVVEPHRAPEST